MSRYCFFFLIFLISCTGPREYSAKGPQTLQSRILEVVQKEKLDFLDSPISLDHRKLSIEEIAEYIDMDIEHTKQHLESMNIHGYYSLSANNCPPQTSMSLYHVDMSGKVSLTKNFYVDSEGKLFTPLDDTFVELSHNYLFFSNYLKGEPIDFVIVSEDGKYLASTHIIPNPIEKIDSKGRKITVEIHCYDQRQYLIRCNGFEPFGKYILITRFENERFVHDVEANEDGTLLKVTGPTAPWIREGTGSVQLMGDNINGKIELHFDWGN